MKRDSGFDKVPLSVACYPLRNDGMSIGYSRIRSMEDLMKRHELEHIIRAAGAISGNEILVIIGSQAILGSYSDPPEELVVSDEADVYPYSMPENADLIDGSIGELSPFHDTFGYFAHGVAPETATLPSAWETRLVKIKNENTGGVTGLCLHPLDIAASKLLAGREKDLDYVAALVKHKLVAIDHLKAVTKELDAPQADLIVQRLKMIESEI